MKHKLYKIILTGILITGIMPSYAESLFKAGISQNAYPQPRSLFGSVRAKNIGDFVTIVIEQDMSTSDEVKLDVKKSTTTDDQFTGIFNRILPGKILPNMSDFGGGTKVASQAKLERKSKFGDTVTAQVIQVLPNGNLLVQAKKTAINSNEKVEIVLSGLIDPRLLDNKGQISSKLVANLQVAVVGNGTVSMSDSEGTINKLLRYLF